jgi:hypothetical protein
LTALETKITYGYQKLQQKLAQEPNPDPQQVKDVDNQVRHPLGKANASIMSQAAGQAVRSYIH